MISKLIGTATLFAAGTLMAGGPASLGAVHVEAFGAEAALTQAGDCGAKDAKEDAKCGKDKKDASCGKDKKEASCGKDKQ